MASIEAKNRFQKLKLRTSSRSPAHSTPSLLSRLGKESQSPSANSTPRGEPNNPIPPDLQGHDAWSRKEGVAEERDGSGKPPLVYDSWGNHAPEADVETSKRFTSQDHLERELLHRDDGAFPDAVHSAPQMRCHAAGFDAPVGLVEGGSASMNVPRARPHEQPYGEEGAHGPEERGIDIPRDDAANLGTSITPRPQHDIGGDATNHFELPGMLTQHRPTARTHMYEYRDHTGASFEDLENIEAVASLTSATTASTQISEARTPIEAPLDSYPPGALPSSPQVGAGSAVDDSPSPVPFPAVPWPSRSSASTSRRNRGLHIECDPHTGQAANGSLSTSRRTARLSSARSSASPALNYLAKWTMAEPAREPNPDDEGQEIGQNSEYIIGRQIGSGGFSVVKEVFTLEAGVQVRRAVKIVKKFVEAKSDAENERLQAEFEHEISIWRFLKHPNLLPLVEAWDTPYATFCITELLDGGTLFDLVRRFRRMGPGSTAASHPHNPYAGYGARAMYHSAASPLVPKNGQSPAQYSTENLVPPHGLPPHLARRYIHQLALALRYLHEDVHVVHRDVKLENCLLDFTSHPTNSQSTEAEPVDNSPSFPNSTPGRPSTNTPSQQLMATVPARLLLCDFGMADYITSDARFESRPASPAPAAGSGSATVALRAALGSTGGRSAAHFRNIGPALPSTLTPSPSTPEHHPHHPHPPHHHHHYPHLPDAAVNSAHHSTRCGYFPDHPNPEGVSYPHARTQPASPISQWTCWQPPRAPSTSQSSAATPRAPSPAPSGAGGGGTGPTATPSSGLIGSLPYAAPELISATRAVYSPAGDVWALGVCAYAVVTGSLPFAHPIEGVLAALVEAGRWDRGKVRDAVARWGGETGELTAEAEQALELIGGCMDTVVERRWTIGQVVESPWFADL